MPDPAQLRREECRREVRRYLAERTPLAFDAPTIRRKLRLDGDDFSDEEIEAAAVFLHDLQPPQTQLMPEELGATRRYRITSAGILAHERRA